MCGSQRTTLRVSSHIPPCLGQGHFVAHGSYLWGRVGFPHSSAVGTQGLAFVSGFTWVLETPTQVTLAWQVSLSELSP